MTSTAVSAATSTLSSLTIDRENRRVDGGALYIGGRATAPKLKQSLEVVDPSTGSVIGAIPCGSVEDVDDAVAAAKAAATGWQFTDVLTRCDLVKKLSSLVRTHADELAWLEAVDSGHYLDKAKDLVGAVSLWLDYHAGLAPTVGGRTIPLPGNRLSMTVLEPLGVTAHIIPWNYPLVLLARSVAPALALGNTVVVKPAEDTSLASLRFAELVHEAGFPPGVFNLVTGHGADVGAALAAHPDVAGVTFTGSVQTGKAVAHLAVDNMAQANLELGGKSPNIVFADADIDDAVEGTVQAFCSHAGQVCVAGTRLFLHEAIKDEFLVKLKERLSTISIGDTLKPGTQMGPLVSRRQLERVREYIEIGKAEGKLVYGGGVPAGTHPGGYFIEPTVFVDVDRTDRIVCEEVFGPVLSVLTWTDLDDLVEQANDSEFGLFACIWSRDIKRALSTARKLQAGGVMVNDWQAESPLAPHGGYKSSGIGRENGLETVASYTQVKHISIGLDESLRSTGDWASAPL
ncbi:aldehyde dehydrogenase [Rhodococcus sp. ACPA4]|uniref:aldehyde dehydrogenase family protein n=1 Tax=Rhodococcus sp. ACPA4 TaxID=2028571 RepID=UPI000BB0F58B|nr:aldehyde dehydrogenase family protein [Rhodococcus sp. ACPA4]PBC35833.1 aldehyde dehydrogenase [Rhodococcus sp. ACPA4]